MGSGSSRLDTRWWEEEAQRKIATTKSTSKVEVICSLIPGMDETTVKGYLKARSDLNVLFELNCRSQSHLNLTADSKVNCLWQALQMPRGYSKPPLDEGWQLPIEEIPSKIAAELHVTICRAIFQIPFFDFVKWALGYNTTSYHLISLLGTICCIRDKLETAFQGRPGIENLYGEVEKALEQKHHPLAHWIVASSLHHTTDSLYDALAPNFDLVQKIFAMRNLDLVLKRLAALHHRFLHVGQVYNWQKWSTELGFWECVDQILWSGKFTVPLIPPHLSTEDWEERLQFLEGLKMGSGSTWGKTMSSIMRLIKNAELVVELRVR